MQFTRFTDYSLRTLMYLATHPERLCTVKEMAQYYGISQNHLVKVVHNLSQLKYIDTIKGKGGGIRLLRKASHINLGKLVIELEPNLNLVECFNEKTNTCNLIGACGFKDILHLSLKAFTNVLENYTLEHTLPKSKVSFIEL